MKKLFILTIVTTLLFLPLAFALEGGSANSFSTDPADYLLKHGFNGTDSTTIPNAETGNTVTETGTGEWEIHNNTAFISISQTGTANLFIESVVPTLNATFDLYFRTGSGIKELQFAGHINADCTGTKLFEMKTRTTTEIQIDDGTNTNANIGSQVRADQNYTFRIVVDETANTINYTVYNLTNQSGTLTFSDEATGTGTFAGGGTQLRCIKISTNEAGVADLFVDELVGWNWTDSDFALIRPTEAVADNTIPSFAEDSINNSLPINDEDILLSQVIKDNIDLSEGRVAHNQSGIFVNQSLQALSGVSFNASDTITVILTKGGVIGYIWWGDDTADNSNTSIIRTVTVQNSPPNDATILFPTASLRTNIQPLDLNVTFPADIDGDSITISYYINGTLNTTSNFNVTFNASDGLYLLEVSLDDGTDFSNNVSAEFEIDTTIPSFQDSSINNSLPIINTDVLVGQTIIDNNDLDFYVLAHNQSGIFVNQTFFDISGVSFNATNTITVTASKGTVIAYVWFVNDTLNNINISEEDTFTVQNTPPENPTIIFPTASLRTNFQPLELNVTFPADADGDVITINYFINGTINSTSGSNSTFTADDGLYFLEVSIDDGTDFSNNVSVLFELDTINPILTLTLPIDASTHSTNIPVDILCTDTNPFLLNYTLFNSTFESVKSVQNSTPIGQEFIIKDLINITGIPDGSYTFNTSCSDTHTVNSIPNYQVFDIPNGKRFVTPNGVDVLIVHVGQPINQNINAVKLKDRYSFEFGTTASRESHTFKVITAKNKIQIIDSEIKGHLIIQDGNDGNWIDFENDDPLSTVIVERVNDKQVNVHVFSDDFNFNSIGGLNVVTESISLTIDTVPPITAAVSFETTGTSGILVQAGAIAIILMVIFGVILELVFKPLRSRFGKEK